jgi:predicted RNase H-like HicB family nuclease
MQEAAYIATIHEENGVLGVSFPDFPGCVTTASDMRSALERGKQALALHVEGMIEDGEALPEPRTMEQLRGEEADWLKDAILALIEVEAPGKALRVNISIDEALLARIDKAAANAGQTRSGFLASAARDRIKATGW